MHPPQDNIILSGMRPKTCVTRSDGFFTVANPSDSNSTSSQIPAPRQMFTPLNKTIDIIALGQHDLM